MFSAFEDSTNSRRYSMVKSKTESHSVVSNSLGFPGGSDGKESVCHVGGPGSIPESGGSPGEGYGNPLQCSCLENPMDTGCQALLQGAFWAQDWTWVSCVAGRFFTTRATREVYSTVVHSYWKTSVCKCKRINKFTTLTVLLPFASSLYWTHFPKFRLLLRVHFCPYSVDLLGVRFHNRDFTAQLPIASP